MNQQNNIETLNALQVQNEKDNLIQVGEVDVGELTHFAAHRRRLIELCDNASAIASLAYLLLQRRWDGRFYSCGTGVLIGLRQDGLFDTTRQSAQNFPTYVERFQPWCDARFALVTAGAADGSSIQGSDSGLDAARLELQRCHAVMTPGCGDLGFVFLQWMMATSRTRWASVELGCVGSERIQLRIPPRAQILAPLPRIELPGVHAEAQRNHDIVLAERVLVLESPAGDTYLIPDTTDINLAEGVWIVIDDGAKQTIRGWYLAN